jgi:hypothetical protein
VIGAYSCIINSIFIPKEHNYCLYSIQFYSSLERIGNRFGLGVGSEVLFSTGDVWLPASGVGRVTGDVWFGAGVV